MDRLKTLIRDALLINYIQSIDVIIIIGLTFNIIKLVFIFIRKVFLV